MRNEPQGGEHTLQAALLDEAAEGREASAGADHDDGRRGVLGQHERRALHEHGHSRAYTV